MVANTAMYARPELLGYACLAFCNPILLDGCCRFAIHFIDVVWRAVCVYSTWPCRYNNLKAVYSKPTYVVHSAHLPRVRVA